MAYDHFSALGPNHVREIDYDDIEKKEIVGKGSFGTVYKGVWENKLVAVKHLVTEVERSLSIEIRQMSRVDHPNIVKLYGACLKTPVCLVMEYAEGGSLYNVLHGDQKLRYNAGHAISWCLQCAKGVAYLHNMRPKALIHRDLKPPNLLLDSTGKVLKICDFGTACDLKTYMSNNKGSPAWMAPEVFEGHTYSEKCDIFSWGIILWQVLSRQKPFNEVGVNALRIMWSVHQGKRPPLIEGCPKPLEILMTKCWSKDTSSRPPMQEVVRQMSALFRFFPEHSEPLVYEYYDSSRSSIDDMQTEEDSCVSDIPESSLDSQKSNIKSISGTTARTDTHLSSPLNIDVKAGGDPWSDCVIQLPEDALSCRQNSSEQDARSNYNGFADSELDGTGATDESTDEFDDKLYLTLEPKLRPLEPDPGCEESVETFKEHKEIAKEYLKVQTELAYLAQKLQDLQEEASRCESLQSETEDQQEVKKLREEKDSLLQYYNSLKNKLDEVTKNNVQKSDWVFVPSNSDPS
ncbi:mitogen-activated protein kinase kinase kinase 7-like [Planococcus citri]|uniref:mitogen-activated protein kinase kinase kinase 7-like n=1 Tax=Planococcus citri TaxID=170843 RepID=UPI0031F835D5